MVGSPLRILYAFWAAEVSLSLLIAMHSDSGCVVVVESESEYDVCYVLLATATESLVATYCID